jgi:succinate dehydrogenase / fumarate reductase cytochrome b subunit
MLMSGSIVLLFIIYHLLHFTFGVVQADNAHLLDPKGRHDVFSMAVRGFMNLPVALSYIAAMVVLGFHLIHGLQSFVQSLGMVRPKYRGMVSLAATGLTLLVVVGNISFPVAVQLGIIKLPGGAQ